MQNETVEKHSLPEKLKEDIAAGIKGAAVGMAKGGTTGAAIGAAAAIVETIVERKKEEVAVMPSGKMVVEFGGEPRTCVISFFGKITPDDIIKFRAIFSMEMNKFWTTK